MNFKSPRSPFQPPSTPGYSRPKAVSRMKPENEEIKFSEEKYKCDPKTSAMQNCEKSQNQLAVGFSPSPSSEDERFCFEIQSPSVSDTSSFWEYTLTSIVSGEYCRYLIFREQELLLKSIPGDAIANTIEIVCDGIQGYKDIQGVTTTKVCSLRLANVASNVDDTSMKTYDILYRQNQDIVWKIPFDLTQLTFRVSVDGTNQEGELGHPINLLFDIRHTGK